MVAACQAGIEAIYFLGITWSLLARGWLRMSSHRPICNSGDGPWLMSM